MQSRSKSESQLKIAKERIEILFREAQTEYKNNPKFIDTYF